VSAAPDSPRRVVRAPARRAVRAGARRALRARAPAKVNLCLFLGPLRADGRHELVTLFESVSLCDELSVEPLAAGADQVVCEGVEGPNLVAQALAGLRRRGWAAPPLRVSIAKRIPVAAGMGGGSADAAAMLRLAPQLAPVGGAELEALARELGADVPSQLRPGLALGTGAGELVEPRAPLALHALAVVPLPERLATPAVYAEADRLGLPRADLVAPRRALERALTPGARLAPELMVNDLEPAARSLRPAIDGALEALAGAGADHVLVCGSGPTVAGVWWGADADQRAEQAVARLRPRYPAATAAAPVASAPHPPRAAKSQRG
jgi:4-diphosphocytidyl-2-C-methyl-D-erythritol kinase